MPTTPITTTANIAAVEQGSHATVEQVLGTYENLRQALADDSLNPIVGLARRLSTEAQSAARSSLTQQKGLLAGLSQSANAVAGADLTQPDTIRKHFGEVSRHVVQLVNEHPELQQGRYLFECPMAQGYGRWIQREPNLMNPYMGKRMLQCGSTVPWGS